MLYDHFVIETFKNKNLKRFFERNDSSGLNPQHVEKIARMLERLDVATAYSDMSLPGWKNHSLKGEFKGFWSVWVSGNYRLIYRLDNGDAYDVDYLDYH